MFTFFFKHSLLILKVSFTVLFSSTLLAGNSSQPSAKAFLVKKKCKVTYGLQTITLTWFETTENW